MRITGSTSGWNFEDLIRDFAKQIRKEPIIVEDRLRAFAEALPSGTYMRVERDGVVELVHHDNGEELLPVIGTLLQLEHDLSQLKDQGEEDPLFVNFLYLAFKQVHLAFLHASANEKASIPVIQEAP